MAENVFLGREPLRFPGASTSPRCTPPPTCCGLGVIDPPAGARLTVSEQQLVEIAKALSGDARVIVMDEPTAALSADEVERLLDVVRAARPGRRSVVYVTHRLDEVFDLPIA